MRFRGFFQNCMSSRRAAATKGFRSKTYWMQLSHLGRRSAWLVERVAACLSPSPSIPPGCQWRSGLEARLHRPSGAAVLRSTHWGFLIRTGRPSIAGGSVHTLRNVRGHRKELTNRPSPLLAVGKKGWGAVLMAASPLLRFNYATRGISRWALRGEGANCGCPLVRCRR